jgi:hypothetical protein
MIPPPNGNKRTFREFDLDLQESTPKCGGGIEFLELLNDPYRQILETKLFTYHQEEPVEKNSLRVRDMVYIRLLVIIEEVPAGAA